MDDSISYVAQQFYCMSPIRFFKWKGFGSSFHIARAQVEILKETILADHHSKYPVSTKYQRSFLKSLISKIEDAGLECDDLLYETYAKLMMDRDKPEEFCFKTYKASTFGFTLKESSQLLSCGTTGLVAWPAAFVMGEWLLDNADLIKGRHILELGCGVGFLGILLCKANYASSYIFSDHHERVLSSLCENLKINNITFQCLPSSAVRVKVEPSDFVEDCNIEERYREASADAMKKGISRKFRSALTDSSIECDSYQSRDDRSTDLIQSGHGNVFVTKIDFKSFLLNELHDCSPLDEIDLIIASDVVFDPQTTASFVRMLNHMLRSASNDPSKNRRALISSTVRNKESYSLFLSSIDQCGLKRVKVHFTPSDVFIYDRSVEVEILQVSLGDANLDT